MSDLNLIRTIEKKIYKKLKEGSNEDYLFDKSGNLIHLNLSDCEINNLSELADILTDSLHLVQLNLSQNRISNITPLLKFKKLKSLNLSNNNIVELSSLGELKLIEQLFLTRNQIIDISFITDLPNIKQLSIAENQVQLIHPLQNATSLLNLDISNNPYVDATPLSGLTQLIHLNVHNCLCNNFSTLGTLSELEDLNLCATKLTDIHFLSNLKKLKKLNLSKNIIVDISPLKDLTRLTELNLDNNRLSTISPLKKLKKLTFLSLCDNKIKKLPFWITDFLMEIKWANENIDGYIYLLNNPLKNPPSEIIKLGKDAINRHFNRIEKEGIDYIYEAKLILVGDGDSGKTSLQTRLINPKSTLPKKDSRTRGIKIHDWNFKTSKNNAQIAHIWDFGGQDVYYPVHRFFLTENSVFVLLASTRQPHHNFDYWIPTIYQFGGQSPIIIGQTCHDGNKTPWNDLSYYLSSPNFNIIKTSHLPYYELNLPKRNEGLKTIKQIIINQIQNLPHYGKGVPNSWIPIRNIISKKSETAACITFAEFREICINSNKNYFVKLIDIEDCAKFFHLIGVLLWYYDNEELKDWVILQPEWAMNAVYKIIDDDEIQKRRGNIIDRDFHRLWNSDQYLGKHFILKRMLEVFKIAFQKKHIKTDYLIPARLLSMPTEKEWKNSSSELRLEYRYEFMPKGMVNQLSAELSRYIISDALVWNNAVIFNSTNNTAQCQVKEDFYNRKIIIKANGREARDLIILVMNSLKDITDGYKGVKPEILVPCLCKKCKKSEKISTYLYDDLVRWSKKSNNAAVTCNESDERITIDKLLYNVGLDKPLNDGKGDFAIKKISLFLASSLKLQDDRDQFEIFINRENNQLIEERLRLELKTCDNDLEYISDQGTQNKYDQSIKNSDISIFLIHAHLGKFTYKEFKIAFEQFKKTGKPYIYTYFKDSPIHPSTLNEEDINRRFQFEEELNLIGHYFSRYENFSDLKYQFKEQLTKILKDL